MTHNIVLDQLSSVRNLTSISLHHSRFIMSPSETEQISVGDQVALSPTSSRASSSSAGSAPSFVESPPPGKPADKPWGSETTSRASSAERPVPGSEVPSSEKSEEDGFEESEEEDSDVSQADVVSLNNQSPCT